MSQVEQEAIATATGNGHKLGEPYEHTLGNDRRVTYRCTECGEIVFTVCYITPWRAGLPPRKPEVWQRWRKCEGGRP